MPIQTSAPITVFDQEAFHAVDKVVRGCAFDIHNELGRYLDERLYQAELAARLSAQNMLVSREMRMTLTLDDFSRDYFADLLVEGGVIIETKAANKLTHAHKAQTLTYLYLCGLHHGTLLNLRPDRVEHQFVSTTLRMEDRRRIELDLQGWKPLTPRCETLYTTLNRALADWGARLGPVLYRDVIVHFLGGESEVAHKVEVRSKHGPLGKQPVSLVAPDIAFSVTTAGHRTRPPTPLPSPYRSSRNPLDQSRRTNHYDSDNRTIVKRLCPHRSASFIRSKAKSRGSHRPPHDSVTMILPPSSGPKRTPQLDRQHPQNHAAFFPSPSKVG